MFCALAHSWRVRGMRLLNHAANKLFIRKFLQSSALILLENKHSYHLKGWRSSCQNSTCYFVSTAGVTRLFDTTMLNVTFTPFTANLLTPNAVSVGSHNLKTTTNLQEDVYVPLCLRVQSCSFVICCLHLQNCTIVVAIMVVFRQCNL